VGLNYYDLKKHKPWFNEGCSKLLDQRKQAKLQWLRNPSKINGDNLNRIYAFNRHIFFLLGCDVADKFSMNLNL
jgi:hypothetical protein